MLYQCLNLFRWLLIVKDIHILPCQPRKSWLRIAGEGFGTACVYLCSQQPTSVVIMMSFSCSFRVRSHMLFMAQVT